MSIEEQWADLKPENDIDFTALLKKEVLSQLVSNNPAQKIRKNLLIHVGWAVIISLLYLYLIFTITYWQIQVILALMILFSVWAIWTALVQYKKLDNLSHAETPVLTKLKYQYGSLINWMRTQEKIGLFFYPLSAMGGFLLGGAEGSGKPISVLLSHPAFLWTMVIAGLLAIPACYYLAKWMFKLSFGKLLNQLKQNIEALETEK